MNHTSAARAASLREAGWSALLLALASHACWGSYPAVSKRLLAELPPFVLVAAGYALVVLAVLPTLRRTPWLALARNGGWWLLMGAVIGRNVTNLLSIEATRATYVQLINLLTPFAVALLGRALFGERVPPRTLPLLLVSTLGSYLVIARGLWPALGPEGWRLADTLGVGLALVSTFTLAFYMLLTRAQQLERGAEPLAMFAQQSAALLLGATLMAGARGEDWGALGQLTPWGISLFLVFVVLNLAGGNLLQIRTLRRLSTTIFTSLIGTRLVVALTLSWLLLGETLTSAWQILGIVLVIGSVTWYVLDQGRVPTQEA